MPVSNMGSGACSECGSENIREDQIRGEVVCEDCGMVISDSGILTVGPIVLERGRGPERLHTEISPGDRDHLGRPVSLGTRSQMFRIRKWQRRMAGYRSPHRNMRSALNEIDRICQVMGLTSTVKDSGHDIYKDALEKGFTLGRAMDLLSAAIVYCSCRICRQPRTLNEIASATGLDRRQLGRMEMRLIRELSLQLPPVAPSDFVDRFCSRLQLSVETSRQAMLILEDADAEKNFAGKDPSGLAAAAIYLASSLTGQTRTQSEVEEYTGITQVTIRKRCREIAPLCGTSLSNGAFPPSSPSLCGSPLRP